MSNEDGFTGEWIVKVHGITGPFLAQSIDDQIRRAIEISGPVGAEVIFDESRWQGGDF